jgi:hypothetical protein
MICALTSFTSNERAQAVVLHQDNRNLNSLAWFSSPRRINPPLKIRRDRKDVRRVGHGSARAIEGLRGLRLPLVSRPDTKERVLQEL